MSAAWWWLATGERPTMLHRFAGDPWGRVLSVRTPGRGRARAGAPLSGEPMRWQLSDRADPAVVPLADRHYNRQHVGSPQFVPPGACVVLRTPAADAFWITSAPLAEYVKHAWPGAWVCAAFRNESPHRSSDLIREAVAATLAVWPEPPPLGMVTFVDAGKVRHKRDPGRCFLRAGFERCGFTKGGLHALILTPDAMPDALEPVGLQRPLVAALRTT